MRSIIAITLVLSVASIASAEIVAHLDGYFHQSEYAAWSHDGTEWIPRSPVGTYTELRAYSTSTKLGLRDTFGPGYNLEQPGDPNTAPNPSSSWNTGYAYGDYNNNTYLSFDISSLETGDTTVLRLQQWGIGSKGGPAQTGVVRRMTTDPQEDNSSWARSDIANAVEWTTWGGDVDTSVSVAYSIKPIYYSHVNYPAGTMVYIDVSTLCDAAIAAGDITNMTLLIEPDGDDDYDYSNDVLVYLTPVENTGALPPALVPEPATMGLLAIGGLALLRRRR